MSRRWVFGLGERHCPKGECVAPRTRCVECHVPRLTEPLRIKNLADKVFWSDSLMAMAMRVLGTKGIGRVLRCQRLFRSERVSRSD